jgi:hypothetical protein
MGAISSHGADLTQFFFYSRFNPVLAHQKILLHKLAGGADVYTLRWLFGLPDDREIDVTRIGNPEIDRHSKGFAHLAWVRVWQKGHHAASLVAVLSLVSCMVAGAALMRRAPAGVSVMEASRR